MQPMQRSIRDVPQAVSAMLDQTRRLESSLNMWASLQVSETEVSDVFVAVGNSFHEMCAAFAQYNIDMT